MQTLYGSNCFVISMKTLNIGKQITHSLIRKFYKFKQKPLNIYKLKSGLYMIIIIIIIIIILVKVSIGTLLSTASCLFPASRLHHTILNFLI